MTRIFTCFTKYYPFDALWVLEADEEHDRYRFTSLTNNYWHPSWTTVMWPQIDNWIDQGYVREDTYLYVQEGL